MSKIIWDDDYNVNIREIDDQHKVLINSLNDLYYLLENKPESIEDFYSFFDALIIKAQEHFATEEKYFYKFNYKDTEAHVFIHNSIKNKVLEFKDRFHDTKDPQVLLEAVAFIEDWLLGHLVEYDKKYTECFNDNGLY